MRKHYFTTAAAAVALAFSLGTMAQAPGGAAGAPGAAAGDGSNVGEALPSQEQRAIDATKPADKRSSTAAAEACRGMTGAQLSDCLARNQRAGRSGSSASGSESMPSGSAQGGSTERSGS